MGESETRSPGLEHHDPVSQQPIGKYYLFVVAIDDYTTSRALENPVDDAASLVTILLSRYQFATPTAGRTLTGERYSTRRTPIIEYNSLEVKCLYNENATDANITAHLDAVYDAIGPDDYFLVYFAGHGDYNKRNKTYYYVPYDEPKKYDFSTVYGYYTDYTTDQKCRDFLMIIDCCFAGAITIGGGNNGRQQISRKVLASSLFDQLADDGLKRHGSAFSRALCSVLNSNTETAAAIDIAKLRAKFADYYREMTDTEPLQKIIYDDLPVSSGSGEFLFRRKHAEKTAHDDLADTFINYLNFKDQKTDLENDGCFTKEESYVPYMIVGIVSKSLDIQKLQVKALFQHFRMLKSNEELQFSNPLVTTPDMMGMDIWEVLKVQFSVTEPDLKIAKVQCAQKICNMLLTDDYPRFPEVQLLMYGCKFQNEEQSEIIAEFCKELIALVTEAKAFHRGKSFKPLMIVVADTREGDAAFLKREKVEHLDMDKLRVVLARPVGDLERGFAVRWHEDAKGKIKNKVFADLPVKSYFNPGQKYDIVAFIEKIAEDLSVDYNLLCGELWNYA